MGNVGDKVYVLKKVGRSQPFRYGELNFILDHRGLCYI